MCIYLCVQVYILFKCGNICIFIDKRMLEPSACMIHPYIRVRARSSACAPDSNISYLVGITLRL